MEAFAAADGDENALRQLQFRLYDAGRPPRSTSFLGAENPDAELVEPLNFSPQDWEDLIIDNFDRFAAEPDMLGTLLKKAADRLEPAQFAHIVEGLQSKLQGMSVDDIKAGYVFMRNIEVFRDYPSMQANMKYGLTK